MSERIEIPEEKNSKDGLSDLPWELLDHIFSFMDIPMLGTMSRVHRGVLRRQALADPHWGGLVHRRYRIATTAARKPQVYGGRDWKEAYRSLDVGHRMPKCRWTHRRAVFAKGRGHAGTLASHLSVWVTLHHTENCRTRGGLRTTAGGRFVEFWVCLQNTKSNGPALRVDVLRSRLRCWGGGGDGGMAKVHSIPPCRKEESSCGYHRGVVPRRLHRHGNAADNDDLTKGIRLQPLEFCVVSIPFACGSDAFETDVLAHTVSLQVPFCSAPTSSGNASTDPNMMEAEAWFVPESNVWDHYMQLPGGCLTLFDRERRLHL